LYRNKTDIDSIEGIQVDAGSLWQLKDCFMVLVDDDQYVTHAYTEDFVLDV
tara:strand:+ start:643 stop:795 length:153 start_codon:yes stop_codon:yes gene_type:complete